MDVQQKSRIMNHDMSTNRRPPVRLERLLIDSWIQVLAVVALYILLLVCQECSSFHFLYATTTDRQFAHGRTTPAIRTTRSVSFDRRSKILVPPLFAKENDEDASESNVRFPSTPDALRCVDELQIDEVNEEKEDLPLFSLFFNEDNLDQSMVPIPMFTASVIFLGSVVLTYYLYDVGINGFPDA
jgi:hypothetical protein